MMRFFLTLFSVSIAVCAGRCGPSRLDNALAARQGACFIVGGAVLPEEVSRGVSDLARVVQCDNQVEISPGIPNILSGDISLVDFDFQKSNLSPLGFAEAAFAIPDQPSTISRDADETLQQQLNAYLAWEAGVRSQNAGNTRLLAQVKSVKFFLGFQRARINASRNVAVGPADTVEHQLGKVIKNSIFASQAEVERAQQLANLVG